MRGYNKSGTFPSVFCILKPLKNYDIGYYLYLMKASKNMSGIWQLPNICLVICIYFIIQYCLYPWQWIGTEKKTGKSEICSCIRCFKKLLEEENSVLTENWGRGYSYS